MPKVSCLRPMPCCIPGCRRNCNRHSISCKLGAPCGACTLARGSSAAAHLAALVLVLMSAPSPLRPCADPWQNLAGHLSINMVRWLLQRGILPLYTPLSGSWLNMAQSLQRIIVRRALWASIRKALSKSSTGWSKP